MAPNNKRPACCPCKSRKAFGHACDLYVVLRCQASPILFGTTPLSDFEAHEHRTTALCAAGGRAPRPQRGSSSHCSQRPLRPSSWSPTKSRCLRLRPGCGATSGRGFEFGTRRRTGPGARVPGACFPAHQDDVVVSVPTTQQNRVSDCWARSGRPGPLLSARDRHRSLLRRGSMLYSAGSCFVILHRASTARCRLERWPCKSRAAELLTRVLLGRVDGFSREDRAAGIPKITFSVTYGKVGFWRSRPCSRP